MKRYLPWIITALCAVAALQGLMPRKSAGEFHTAEFGRLPVLLNGRVQPLDSVARNTLLFLRGKQTVHLDGGGSLSAIDWLMEVTMKPELAKTRKVFRIDHPDLKSLLGLPPEGVHDFAFVELQSGMETLSKEARRVSEIEQAVRNPFEKSVSKLANALATYRGLQNTLRPETSDDFAAELAKYKEVLPKGIAAFRKREAGEEFNKEDWQAFVQIARDYDTAGSVAQGMLIPPFEENAPKDAWQTVGGALIGALRTGAVAKPVELFATMATSFRQQKPADFNKALDEYTQWLATGHSKELNKARWEFVFRDWQPFYQTMVLYVVIFLLGCASWFGGFQVTNRSAYYVLILAFIVHTSGIVFRMALEGRPPVTNLYSSAVFVGWGAVGLGILLERFYRNSIGAVMASMVGFSTQIVAHHLSLEGDTMEMLRAVLDTNFWLATHVVTITLGYSATFVAGFLAVLYVVRGFFTKSLDATTRQSLYRMVYGIVCFATLFSFVGTVLGGIWADQSWGRFWGWDPKENGALIIVLWNAILLHARWGGLVKERGLMNLAIFGNVVTSYSWFGVNMLGVGLHSYGFMDQAFIALKIFILLQIALIGIGLLPFRFWASVRGTPAANPNPTPKPAGAGGAA